MQRLILVPGAFAGFGLGIVFIALHAGAGKLSFGVQEIAGLIAMAAVTGGGQAFALGLAHRDPPAGMRMPFVPRYFVAMLTGAITAVAFGIVTWLDFRFVNTGFLEDFHARYLERVRSNASSPEELQQMLAAAEPMQAFITDPFSQAMVQAGTVLMISLLTALLAAALMKQEP